MLRLYGREQAGRAVDFFRLCICLPTFLRFLFYRSFLKTFTFEYNLSDRFCQGMGGFRFLFCIPLVFWRHLCYTFTEEETNYGRIGSFFGNLRMRFQSAPADGQVKLF